MADKNLVDFFPSKSMHFLQDVSEQIIERRRAKLEVKYLEIGHFGTKIRAE